MGRRNGIDCRIRTWNPPYWLLWNSDARVDRHAAMMEVCASMINHMVTLTVTREISSIERPESVLAAVSSRVRLTFGFCARFIGGTVDDSKIIDPYRCGNDAAGGALLVFA